jgi:hypothetical protein
MSDRENPDAPTIAECQMLGRLAQSEQMREFFVQMWLQNPMLAKRAGKRIQDLMSPITAVAEVDSPSSVK